jgi:Plant specific eukaryotic initiation factor 4B
MERAKSRENRFGFSWADEVEREEEQEMKMQTNQLPIPIQRGMRVEKPDPFGAARAHEIILEEKGVDWKKLDQDFDFGFDSSIRLVIYHFDFG